MAAFKHLTVFAEQRPHSLLVAQRGAFFDPRLSEFTEIWAAAGTPRHIFPIAPADLLRITGANSADFTK